jgi:hypothetical protein
MIEKAFLAGFMGALLALVLAAVVMTQYTEARSRSESAGWLVELQPVQQMVEAGLRQGNLAAARSQLAGSQRRLGDDGSIVLQGGRHGQQIYVYPERQGAGFVWHCLGGSVDDVPSKCR